MDQEELKILVRMVRLGRLKEAELARMLEGEVSPSQGDGNGPVDSRAATDELTPWEQAPTLDDLPVSKRYRVGDSIGEGGTGIVFEAEDRLLKRQVALKILSPARPGNTAAFARFLYEPRITGFLAHPGIIPIFDIGKLPDGNSFFSMQRVSGRDLDDVLTALRRGDPEAVEHFTLQRLVRIFAHVCMTMAYAHDHGVIHRDLKPSNIMLGHYDEVYVADWGLAKCFDGSQENPAEPRPGEATQDGTLLGTVGYMAPEQVEGRIDDMAPASDIFSLGVMLYELLTLKMPYNGPTAMSIMFQIAQGKPRDPREFRGEREIPDALAELTLEAMQHDPKRRPASARELAERANAFLDGVEERKRRHAWGHDLEAKARVLFDEYLQQRDGIAEARGRLRETGSLPLDAKLEARRAMWAQRQALNESVVAAEQTITRGLQAAEHAFELTSAPSAAALLEEMYWLKSRDAARTGDASTVHFRELARQYATQNGLGRYAEQGVVVLEVPEPDAVVRVLRQVSLGPITRDELVSAEVGKELLLPVGSYVAEVHIRDRMDMLRPFLVSGDAPSHVRLSPPPAFLGCDEFAFVDGGQVTLGGDPQAPAHLPAHRVEMAPFLIGRYPVTLRQYCEFLNHLAGRDVALAMSHAPRAESGATWLAFDPEDRRFDVPATDRDGDAWSPQWPAHMLSWQDATAYCAWRSERDGVTVRLPTELEWEYAARGVDERAYPWGNGFDPTLCRMMENVVGKALPVPVGSFPFDRSPWGVYDMAGLVLEYTADPRVSRGGGTRSPRDWCRACARRIDLKAWSTIAFGFRIVRELT